HRRYEVSSLQPTHRLFIVTLVKSSRVGDKAEQVRRRTEDGRQMGDGLDIPQAQSAIFDLADAALRHADEQAKLFLRQAQLGASGFEERADLVRRQRADDVRPGMEVVRQRHHSPSSAPRAWAA